MVLVTVLALRDLLPAALILTLRLSLPFAFLVMATLLFLVVAYGVRYFTTVVSYVNTNNDVYGHISSSEFLFGFELKSGKKWEINHDKHLIDKVNSHI